MYNSVNPLPSIGLEKRGQNRVHKFGSRESVHDAARKRMRIEPVASVVVQN
jgi:hypothetical protein